MSGAPEASFVRGVLGTRSEARSEVDVKGPPRSLSDTGPPALRGRDYSPTAANPSDKDGGGGSRRASGEVNF